MNAWMKLALLLLSAGLLVPEPAVADSGAPKGEAPTSLSSGTWTLSDVLEATWHRSPLRPVAGWRVAAARGQARQESLWPNPVVQVDYENFGWNRPLWSGSESTILWTQALPVSGRMGAVRKRGVARESAARDGQRVELSQMLYDAEVAFVEALAASQRVERAREGLTIAREALLAVEAVVDAGKLAPAELFLVQMEVELEQARVQALEATATSLLSRLASHWGGRPEEVSEVVGSLELPPDPPQWPEIDGAARGIPTLDLADSSCVEARSAVALEKKRATPDLEVGLGVRSNDGLAEQALVLSISMPLPLLDRNSGAIDEAYALERMTCTQGQWTRRRWEAEVLALRQEATGLWNQHASLKSSVLPAVEKAYLAVRTGIAGGKMRSSDLLAARRRMVELQQELIDVAEQFLLVSVRLDEMTGGLLAPFEEEQP